MSVHARSFLATTTNSLDTGRELAQKVQQQLSGQVKLLLAYLTINHDQEAFLRGAREVLGPDVSILGCSAQGIVANRSVREDGYAAGVLALGGSSLSATAAAVEQITGAAFERGEALGRQLLASHAEPPKAVLLYYDSLCGVDPEAFLQGLYQQVKCPIVGAGAAHSFNYRVLQETYAYIDGRVLTRAASACALFGDFSVEIESCHGCSPVGVELTVTRAEHNVLYELDGRRAYDVWTEVCGDLSTVSNQSSALAIGVPVAAASDGYLVRAAYGLDPESGAVTIGPRIPNGSKLMLHHRTVDDVLDGARRMGERLRAKLAGKRPRAALGFECGARTRPFLGDDVTLRENLELQGQLGEGVAWLGLMPWGEIYPIADRPSFHNYSYPVLVIAE